MRERRKKREWKERRKESNSKFAQNERKWSRAVNKKRETEKGKKEKKKEEKEKEMGLTVLVALLAPTNTLWGCFAPFFCTSAMMS